MNRKNKDLIKLLLVVLIIGSISVGCRIQDDIAEEEISENEISLDVGGKDYDILMRSENISDLVVNLYGIDNATSIIFNDMVVIGIEMAEGFILTDDMKEMIINTVLENDTMIRQVLITGNKPTFDQIEKVIESLMNGRAYDDQIKEINRIMEKMKKE